VSISGAFENWATKASGAHPEGVSADCEHAVDEDLAAQHGADLERHGDPATAPVQLAYQPGREIHLHPAGAA
jgi:hypothetical protein